ncbi:MAG: DegT/DnrJ/EryC1/StrS aminotransferase family protein [Verrucomicrobiota bacterium]|jgi:dTDP-4-amino-4,6-dideoxygalactose transaminase
MKIPFAKIAFAGNEWKYLQEVLASGWLTTASKTLDLEKRFAEVVGARHACAVNSCTAALHLALEAIGIGPGDKVLVPTLTFTATAEVVRYLGADPVFVDVDYRTGLLTPEILAGALTRHPGIKAVMVVHFGGQAAQMAASRSPDHDGILDVCRKQGVKVVEDAAHAFPTRHQGRMVGSFGDVTCFSFYANKTITTGEGGMLVTEDEAIDRRAKNMRLHGIDHEVWDRFTANKACWEYDVTAPGFKYNMPDINAAIGLAQLERAQEMRTERQRCLEYYQAHLGGLESIDLPVIHGSLADHSCHLFWLVLNKSAPIPRNRLIELLYKAGIGTSVHYKPLHRMTYYRDRYQLKEQDYPNAEKHWQGCVSLPVYPSMSNQELAYVVAQVKRALGNRA